MALTSAERQAAFKARKAETLDALAQQNAALMAEVAELRAELDAMKEKAHRLEVAALKAQLKRAEAPAAKATPAKTPAKQLSKAPRQR
jgi:regulator of replication initiation timing